jgi:hypothetical protein
MKRIDKVVWAVVAGCMLAALPAIAQPGGGGGRGGSGGGVSPGQILGLMAFEDKFEVTDEQLIALRSSLKESYVKEQEMLAEMLGGGGGDRQAMREKMRESQMAMRSEVMDKVSEVLSEDQVEVLKTHMQEQQERRGQFGGGRGGRGGGGGGGRGF